MGAAEPAVCRVLFAPLSAASGDHVTRLTALELGRRERYVRGEDRDRFTLATVLLRVAVAAWVDVAVDDVAIDRTCPTCGEPHGRPRVVGHDVHVSIAHSGGFVGVALCGSAPVGLDVEEVGRRPYEDLVDDVCAPSERPSVTGPADFYAYWTRKESVLKALGVGLEEPMTSLLVTPPGAPPAVVSYRDAPLVATMADVGPADGYAGAVTVLSAGPVAVESADGTPLLPG